TGMTPTMRVGSEETFGPVAPLFRFTSEDEALEIANSTVHGLAAYFYTENIRRSWRVAEGLQFGMVGLNTGRVSVEEARFGRLEHDRVGPGRSPSGPPTYLHSKT